MANCKKYTKAACGHLFKHYERAKDENGEYLKFGNQEIDTGKSHLNYNLAVLHQPDRQGDFVKQRCSEVKMQNRADVNVMCSWIVTVPKQIEEDETERFFKETYKFLSERYGRDNVISAHVHMDETTPHIHFAFVPVVRDKKKDILKVSAKEAIHKKELQTFHKDLSAHMERIFGRDVGVQNEATKEGNQAIEELKRGTARQELEEIKQQAEEIKKESAETAQGLKESKAQLEALKKEEKDLNKQIKSLEDKFKSKELTIKELEQIQPIKGAFGLKNITMDDIENLKSTAMLPLQSKKTLNVAKQEIARLKIEKSALQNENADLKTKIPSMKEQLAQNQREIKMNDLENENSGLKSLIQKILSALPEREREIAQRIINPPKRQRSHDIDLN